MIEKDPGENRYKRGTGDDKKIRHTESSNGECENARSSSRKKAFWSQKKGGITLEEGEERAGNFRKRKDK